MGLETQSKAMTWTGRVLSTLPVLGLLMSASMKLKGGAEFVAKFTGQYGYPSGTIVPIGITEIACTILYVIPQTSYLGAILLTGYLGGAVSTHVRAGEGPIGPIAFGVLIWLGLFLRDARLRALVPLTPPSEKK